MENPNINLEELQEFQEEMRDEFQERIQRYYEREEQAQKEFNTLIRPEED